jgi:hypothetical protein
VARTAASPAGQPVKVIPGTAAAAALRIRAEPVSTGVLVTHTSSLVG